MRHQIELLEQLIQLRRDGLLNEDEFQSRKLDVLAGSREVSELSSPSLTRPRPNLLKTARRFWPALLLGLLAVGSFGAIKMLAGGTDQGSSLLSPARALKVEDPGGQIMMEMVQNLEQTRKDWVGRYIEFKFWPDSYTQVGDRYVFTGTDTPFTCEVDKDTFEKILLRQPTSASHNVIVRGKVGTIELNEPLRLEGCELVTLDDRGWTPELRVKSN